VFLPVLYLANRALPIGSTDTEAAILLPLSVLRGHGPFLDPYAPVLERPGAVFPAFLIKSRGHLVSRYPVGPALLLVSIEAPQVWVRDRLDPGWDRTVGSAFDACQRMTKISSAVVAALAALALSCLLHRFCPGWPALSAALAAAVGSDLWVVGSQAPWPHAPAALALTLSMLLLSTREPPTRWRLALGGLTTAALVVFRAIDVVFAVAVFLWVARYHGRRLGWFLPAPLLLGAALIGYNLWFFGSVAGGQPGIESLHPTLHGTEGIWTGRLLEGAEGTLFSPSRGLFVFCPWVVLALAALPATAKRIGERPLVGWLLVALVPYGLLLSKYSIWWGGHCFGPRYWTDAVPLFAVMLAFGLEWAWSRSKPLLVLFGLAIGFSVAVQAVGAFCYPSTWNWEPANVDTHHERLWDWADSELSRCLREGVKPW
jgi:hypothetical protein